MQERKMTKKEKSKEKRLKKKYDDSDMKASMKKQYGKDWKAVYYATIRKRAMEQANEGYQILPPIDKERYTEIPGMEGPMMTRSGKVVYYDPQEGAYYDRDTDMYLTYDEWSALDEDSPMKTAIDKAVAQAMSTPAPAYSVRPKARPKNLAPSSSLRPRARPTINIGSVRKGDPATRGIDPRDNYSPEDLKRLLMQSAMERLQAEGEAGDHDRMYKVVHAKKGVMDIKAKTSYEAAKKFAKEKGLKSTAGVDAHLYPLEESKSEGDAWYIEQDARRMAEKDGHDWSSLPYGRKSIYRNKAAEMRKDDDEDDMYEGAMSDLHAQIMSSDDPHDEIYKMLTGNSPEERYIQLMYNDTSAEYGLHPDDDFEDIIDRMVNDMEGDMSFEGHSVKESARGLGSIDWPDTDEDGDSAMAQHAENAIRHDMHAYDAYDHVYSMSRERDWLSDNKDMIIDMFAQYGLQTEGHSPHKKGTKKYKAHMAAMHANSAEPKGKMLEGYEGEVSAILQALDIEHHWSNGYLHVNQRDLEDVKNRLADTDMDMPSIKVYEGGNKMGPQGITPGDRVEHEGEMYQVVEVDGDILTVDNLQTGNRTKFRMDDVTRLFGMDAMTDQDKQDAEAMFKRLDKVGSGSLKHVATEGNYGKKKKKKKKYETVDIKKVKSAVNMQESTDSQAVAEYIRINLNESHDTWEKVNEEVYHVIGNLTEGHSADPLEVYSAVHKRHMQQYFDHEMGIKENVNTLRKIVKDRSAMTVKFEDGTMKVDMTTANIFLQAYDQMKERNQEKIDQMMRTKAGFLRVMDFIYGAMK